MNKVFIAVSPGFYKTNLFNELAKRENFLVVYTGSYNTSTRNADFLGGEKRFNSISIVGSKLTRLAKMISLLLSERPNEVIIGGYDNLFCWAPLLLTKKKRCSLIVESTYRETVTYGIRFQLKRLFISRISRVYAPGTPHAKLVKDLGYKGEIRLCNSVGLINAVSQPLYIERKRVSRFLFVGRLIPEKNLPWLINMFKKHRELQLTIVGFGAQETYLKSLVACDKTENIVFVGAVNNNKLSFYYQNADVFILPSKTETWGLVIEEALNNGTPIMCSHMVGCADDLVIAKNNGVVFHLDDEDDFENKLKEICNIDKYNQYRENVSKMDFKQHEKEVVEAFVN